MKSWKCVKEINFWVWFEGWVFSIAFEISYRLCLLMTMHCVWCWITCTAQLYYSHVSASVITTRWILTKSPRCDGINLCRGVVRSEPDGGVDQYSSYCSVFQASSFKLKAVFRYYTRAVSNTSRSLLYMLLSYLSPETWLSIIWQKKPCTVFVEIKLCMTVVVLSYFIGWNLTFLVCWKGT